MHLALVKQWLSDWSPAISIVLTIAIAAAAWAQVQVAKRSSAAAERSNELQNSVLALQQQIEKSRHRVFMFCQLLHTSLGLVLRVDNLCPFGIS